MIGLDIARSVFQVHAVDRRGKVVLRKRLSRAKVLAFLANRRSCLIGLEAGGGAHHGARELTGLGHAVRLMPPQYVKPHVKTNQHAAAGAEGCCTRRAAPTSVVGAGRQARSSGPTCASWRSRPRPSRRP